MSTRPLGVSLHADVDFAPAEVPKSVIPMSGSALSAVHVSLSFRQRKGELQVLDDISFTVKSGEFVCIAGPSGAGKTTLLNVLAGLLESSAGHIEVNGRRVTGPGADRGVVFQDDAVFPWLTVARNIEYPLRLRKEPRRERRTTVDRLIALVDLTEFRNTWPRQLSGGMRKRVDLARAYAADPAILLMDEPLASLDVQTKETLQTEISRLWQLDLRPTIFVTHDLEEGLFLGTRILVLSKSPARIIKDLAIPKPFPRSVDWKLEPDFVELRRNLRELISNG